MYERTTQGETYERNELERRSNEQDTRMHQRQRERNRESRNESKDSWEWGRNAVREVGWGMVRSRQTRTKRRHSGGEEVAAEDAGFDVRQLCVRKHDAEERDEPVMLFSSSPCGAVEVGVLEPLLDLG